MRSSRFTVRHRVTIRDVSWRARGRQVVQTVQEMHHRFSAIRGSTLSAALSMRAFLGLFPIALLVLAAIGIAGGDARRIGQQMAQALGLGDEFGRALARTIRTAEGRQLTSSLLGVAGLIWAGTGLSAAMAAAWDAAWDTPGGVVRGRAAGVAWIFGGLAFLAATVGTSTFLHSVSVRIELGVIGGVIASALFLFWTALLLPERAIPWRAMVRPAVYGGIALEVLRDVGATVVPALVRRSSSAYGAVGATFALLVWLLVMGRVIVYSALYERIRWERVRD
jgi:membrane protein